MSFYTEAGGERFTASPNPQADAQGASSIPQHSHSNNQALMPPASNPGAPKSVAFELLVQNMPNFKARLPMRVQIYPHDTTESIIATVKNFYGLYGGPGRTFGVSFEDVNGNTLIARYENFHDKMNVYIRVQETIAPTSGQYGPGGFNIASPPNGQANNWNGQHPMLPPQAATTRPDSRASSRRSISPGRGRRSGSSNQKNKKPRSGGQSRGSSTHGSFVDIYSDGAAGYSSGDGAPGSVSSRSRADLGNPEISVANIVEGGRRKRAKFDSSELPLFAPPQMPAATSNSSVSPARRMDGQRAALPFAHPGQHAFAHPHVLQSPQSYGAGLSQSGPFVTPNNAGRHSGPNFSNHRGSISNTPNSNNLLPTPDATIGSCMSEEDKDVALQLMRLGAMSNQGSHARTSTSTMDDTFSGRAAASSTGATSDEESASEEDDDLPPARRQRLEYSPILPPGVIRRLAQPTEDLPASQDSTEMSGEELEDGRDATFNPENGNGANYAGFVGEKPRSRQTSVAKPRAKSGTAKSKAAKAPRSSNGVAKTKTSKNGSVSGKAQPMSPASMSNHSRKTSVASGINFQHQLGEDEEDLSSKPRCQRCRKSKKGCDRQRPCQRCKDAGLSAEQCVSEDEGNGRKGRYGRHMGVKVKKDEQGVLAGQGQFYAHDNGAQIGMETFNTAGSPDKSKKRKR